MEIIVNGENMAVGSDITVSSLLETINQDAQRVVVELNREILGKEDYSKTSLKEGDSLEIIQFVPGG
jgi:sulfur carrier protein